MNSVQISRRRRAEQRRAQLIETALNVFAQKGVEGTTIKDLSEAAGVAPGLVYHYFDSKEALLQAALERHYFLPELHRLTVHHRDRPASQVLLEVAERFAALLRERRALVQVMIREAPSNPMVAERLERARSEGTRVLAEYLASRVAAGELRPHDTEASARLLLYAVVTAHLTDTPLDRFLPAMVDVVVHGLTAR